MGALAAIAGLAGSVGVTFLPVLGGRASGGRAAARGDADGWVYYAFLVRPTGASSASSAGGTGGWAGLSGRARHAGTARWAIRWAPPPVVLAVAGAGGSRRPCARPVRHGGDGRRSETAGRAGTGPGLQTGGSGHIAMAFAAGAWCSRHRAWGINMGLELSDSAAFFGGLAVLFAPAMGAATRKDGDRPGGWAERCSRFLLYSVVNSDEGRWPGLYTGRLAPSFGIQILWR